MWCEGLGGGEASQEDCAAEVLHGAMGNDEERS